MTLENLKKLNSNLKIYGIDSPEFKEYGRRITDIDTTEIVKAGQEFTFPQSGSIYEASTPAFESLNIAKEITDKCFGELDTQIGYCYGHNNYLNALEWHTASEINIAVTDLVLILAKRSDLTDNKMDSSVTKCFLLKKGDIAEVYATSLHFCPCEVSSDGFGCVVGLPKNTNTPLNEKSDNKLLFAKNKWLIAHNDNAPLIARGAVAGISGENYKINY